MNLFGFKFDAVREARRLLQRRLLGGGNEGLELSRREDGYFPITSIHRADLEDRGFDVTQVTDEQMERLAEKMGEVYVESGAFWNHMEDLSEEMGIPYVGDPEDWPRRKVI
ncbi:MAG: hypothetical protein FJ106_09225 [Deltaproteobacteria bacterium]|nr:hypothetical protein [Deltaproteobacteria bacterium]